MYIRYVLLAYVHTLRTVGICTYTTYCWHLYKHYALLAYVHTLHVVKYAVSFIYIYGKL